MRTQLVLRRTAVAATMVLACSAGLVLSGGSAQAAAAEPDGTINHSCGPAINVNSTTSRHVVTPAPVGGATIRLEAGRSSRYGTTYWAHLLKARKGSSVWMDWSDDGGHNWHQCGPYSVDGSQGAHDRWTWGVNWVGGRKFRACAHQGYTHCTIWK
ncbi:hypothetical protein [Streptomyces orinoci]|uniref:Secreted protein n=1 Tax=Streptomyces orinoci TaxID=67339 RepID=A0ABV3K2S9_STRON|nr:hypothetical protein [Streptomyces orinoci]